LYFFNYVSHRVIGTSRNAKRCLTMLMIIITETITQHSARATAYKNSSTQSVFEITLRRF
jgi:hypothetical protein